MDQEIFISKGSLTAVLLTAKEGAQYNHDSVITYLINQYFQGKEGLGTLTLSLWAHFSVVQIIMASLLQNIIIIRTTSVIVGL